MFRNIIITAKYKHFHKILDSFVTYLDTNPLRRKYLYTAAMDDTLDGFIANTDLLSAP